MARLKIDAAFKALGVTQTEEERSLLLASLLKEGCRDCVVVWKGHGVIIDGHTREQMCHEHEISFRTKELAFKDRGEVVNWIIDNQLGRRNVNDEQKSYLRGKRYIEEKKPHGGDRKSADQDATVASCSPAEELAEKFGVSERTIHNDAKFAEAVDALAESIGPDIKTEILSGESELSKKDILHAAAETTPAKQAKAITTAKKPKPRSAANDGPKHKSGKQKNDPRPFESWTDIYGKLARATDDIARVHPADKFKRECHERLNMAYNTIQAWKKATR